MSLHAQISDEAQAALDAQKKTSTISSVIISILAILLLGLVLYVISLTIASKVNPEIYSVGSSLADPDDIQEEVTETEVTKQPASPSSSAAKVISALTNSPDSIPTPVTEVADLSLEMGDNTDFGDGWGNGNGTGSGSGAGGFGGAKVTGTMGGYFYDLKQTKKRKAVKGSTSASGFGKIAKGLHRRRFSKKALAKYYKGEKELFVRYIAIPFGLATQGPAHFGVEKEVKPSGWIVHYSAKVKAPKTGRFRFVGLGDDYLAVGINSKPHLIAPWWSLRKILITRSANSDPKVILPGPFGVDKEERLKNNLLFGRWFDVKAGEELTVDIAIGERPGGKMGYILMIEEEGVEYEKQPSGSPILPPFCVGTLHKDDIAKLKAYPNWKFKLDDVPVFTAQD